jgi:hypothetical protein
MDAQPDFEALWQTAAGLDDEELRKFRELRQRLRATPVSCPWCRANGTFPSEGFDRPCPACDATGTTNGWRWLSADEPADDEPDPPTDPPDLGPGWRALFDRVAGSDVPCPQCGGTGYRCLECGKTGRISAGMAAIRETIRLARMGGEGISDDEAAVGVSRDRGELDGENRSRVGEAAIPGRSPRPGSGAIPCLFGDPHIPATTRTGNATARPSGDGRSYRRSVADHPSSRAGSGRGAAHRGTGRRGRAAMLVSSSPTPHQREREEPFCAARP